MHPPCKQKKKETTNKLGKKKKKGRKGNRRKVEKREERSQGFHTSQNSLETRHFHPKFYQNEPEIERGRSKRRKLPKGTAGKGGVEGTGNTMGGPRC